MPAELRPTLCSVPRPRSRQTRPHQVARAGEPDDLGAAAAQASTLQEGSRRRSFTEHLANGAASLAQTRRSDRGGLERHEPEALDDRRVEHEVGRVRAATTSSVRRPDRGDDAVGDVCASVRMSRSPRRSSVRSTAPGRRSPADPCSRAARHSSAEHRDRVLAVLVPERRRDADDEPLARCAVRTARADVRWVAVRLGAARHDEATVRSRSGHSAKAGRMPNSLMNVTPSANRIVWRCRLRTAWNSAADGWYEGLENAIMSSWLDDTVRRHPPTTAARRDRATGTGGTRRRSRLRRCASTTSTPRPRQRSDMLRRTPCARPSSHVRLGRARARAVDTLMTTSLRTVVQRIGEARTVDDHADRPQAGRRPQHVRPRPSLAAPLCRRPWSPRPSHRSVPAGTSLRPGERHAGCRRRDASRRWREPLIELHEGRSPSGPDREASTHAGNRQCSARSGTRWQATASARWAPAETWIAGDDRRRRLPRDPAAARPSPPSGLPRRRPSPTTPRSRPEARRAPLVTRGRGLCNWSRKRARRVGTTLDVLDGGSITSSRRNDPPDG